MMSDKQKLIRKLLGYFWTQIWEDDWLIDAVISINKDVLYPHMQKQLQNIYKQTSVSDITLQNTAIPQFIAVDLQSKTNAVIPIQQLVIGSGTATSVDQKLSDTYAYNIINDVNYSKQIKYKPLDSDSLSQTYVQDAVLITKQNLKQASRSIKTIDDKLYSCAQLWSNTSSYKIPLDIYTRIIQIPSQWAYKYPRSVYHAWHIRMFGATQFHSKALIGCVCQCPVAQEQGVVTKIQQDTVFINGTGYKCWSENSILVRVGSVVKKGQALCSYTSSTSDILRVYTGKVPQSTIVPSIPVITSAGVLYAQNRSSSCPAKNVLPLTGSSETLQKYKTLVTQLSANQAVPYTEVNGAVNPMQFLIQKVWGSCCVIFVIPDKRSQDLQIALQCILKNMPVGSIVTVYQQTSINKPLQLNLTATAQIIAYYEESVNNNLTLQVS